MHETKAATLARLAAVTWTASLALHFASLPALAQPRQPSWPESMTIGTGSAGGTYNVYGQALARLLTRELGLQVLTRPSEGPAENL